MVVLDLECFISAGLQQNELLQFVVIIVFFTRLLTICLVAGR